MQCKVEEKIPEHELLNQGFTVEQIPNVKIFKGIGCEHCTNGYKGRVGIYEVIKITPDIATIIMEGGNSLDVAEQCQKEGFNNLRQSGLIKAMNGITSLEEINRVTSS
jgi:type IV pilus assembly protein PilB